MPGKRVIIYSLFKQATKWVTRMINTNAVDSVGKNRPVDVVHEGFLKQSLKTLRHWRDLEHDMVVVGPAAHMMTAIMDRRPDTKWCCLWRDPLDHMLSLHRADNRYSCFGGVLFTAMNHWSAREAALRTLEQAGIEVTHWHIDYYTTPDGFRDMASSVGLTLNTKLKLLPPQDVTNYSKKLAYEDFALPEAEAKTLVMDRFNSLEYSKAAYVQARRGPQ